MLYSHWQLSDLHVAYFLLTINSAKYVTVAKDYEVRTTKLSELHSYIHISVSLVSCDHVNDCWTAGQLDLGVQESINGPALWVGRMALLICCSEQH